MPSGGLTLWQDAASGRGGTVDAGDLKSSAPYGRAGSSPAVRTSIGEIRAFRGDELLSEAIRISRQAALAFSLVITGEKLSNPR